MNKPFLLVRKIYPDAILPTKAHDSDLGWDLYFHMTTGSRCILEPNRSGVKLYTGVAIKLPDNYGGIIRDRSSMAGQGLMVSGGVIDNGYIGELIVQMNNMNDEPIQVHKGQKIAQLILIPIVDVDLVEVSSLPITDRGEKGFGSSGA